jgi:2-polyprenyl-6-methoxyphenol hydroxylase-like FAD-dependent oxidoreductase
MRISLESAEDYDVAICGAGPVGLLLAAELAAHDIRVIVLERSGEPSEMPKANGIVGHTAVELSKRGYLAGSRLRVLSPPQFQFGPLALKLGFGPGNPLHILPIPQRRLEALFEQRALERGVTITRGNEVMGFRQTDDDVTVETRDADGKKEVRTSYLLGCDGAHSVVRKHAGIEFPGFTSDEISRIARVTIPAGRITSTRDGFEIPDVGRVVAMRPNQLNGGGFSIAPASVLDSSAPTDLYLVSTHEPRGDLKPSDSVTVDELRASLHRVLGAELPFSDAVAIRSTVGTSRQAENYRRGRVFLVGDAAHIFNAGGSSLNVGLQDALDLASRLTAVMKAKKPTDTLDKYNATRWPAGLRALEHTRAQAALSRNDATGHALRGVLGTLVGKRSTARRLARILEDA